MHEAKVKRRKRKIFRAMLFIVPAIFVITTLIAWFSGRQNAGSSRTNEIAAYKKLDMLIAKLITTQNSDSLSSFTKVFNYELYQTETASDADSTISLAMRRFKFELNDKVNGIVNILDSGRFERTGRYIIWACANQISKLSEN
jgi:hypothetical protein